MNKFVATAIVLCLGTAAVGVQAQQKKFDPYTEGAKSGKFDPYTEGANKSTRAELTDASAAEPKPTHTKKNSTHKKHAKKAASGAEAK